MKLSDLRAIANRRTAGEWWFWQNYLMTNAIDENAIPDSDTIINDDEMEKSDAQFIATASAVFDKLLDIAEAAKGLIWYLNNWPKMNDNKDATSGIPLLIAKDELSVALAALETDEDGGK